MCAVALLARLPQRSDDVLRHWKATRDRRGSATRPNALCGAQRCRGSLRALSNLCFCCDPEGSGVCCEGRRERRRTSRASARRAGPCRSHHGFPSWRHTQRAVATHPARRRDAPSATSQTPAVLPARATFASSRQCPGQTTPTTVGAADRHLAGLRGAQGGGHDRRAARPPRPPRRAGRHGQFNLSGLRDARGGACATTPVRPGRIPRPAGLKAYDRLDLSGPVRRTGGRSPCRPPW